MSITGVSTSSLLPTVLAQANEAPQPQADTSTMTSGQDSNPAYLLSLGQQRAETELLGYNQLRKLINQTETALSAIPGAEGPSPTTQYAVDIQQMAQAQSLNSNAYPDSNRTVIATGALTVQSGAYDGTGNTFNASGDPITIQIQDGTLDGIASAINAANAGITASITKDSDGQYRLQTMGNDTGAANAFIVSGISSLAYDPTVASTNGLMLTQIAQNAEYTVDGIANSHPSNQGAPIAPGIDMNFTATGFRMVSVPAGQQKMVQAANTFASVFNTLLANLNQIVGSGGQLSGDPNVASRLTEMLGQIAHATYHGKSFASIGLNSQPDGTLAIDSSKLQSAYASNPVGTQTMIDQASAAISRVLSGAEGSGGQIGSEMQALFTTMRGPSLMDYLSGNANPSDVSSMFSALDPSTFRAGLTSPSIASSLAQGDPSLAAMLSARTSGGPSLAAATSSYQSASGLTQGELNDPLLSTQG
jgi:flagellar hook-associated protein 2